jgi:signal transduction histidine kinase/CHASE2 domain-containing sensor protein
MSIRAMSLSGQRATGENKRWWGPARRYWAEWLMMGAIGVVIVAVASLGCAMTGLDRIAYDGLSRLHSRPHSPDIAVVEIDDASIEQFGLWPWPYGLQARLVRAVAKAGAAAIVYNVALTGPALDDVLLADAMRTVPTFLPLLPERKGRQPGRVVVWPAKPLLDAAAGTGHGNLEPDPDGVLRSISLGEAGDGAYLDYIDVPVARAIRDGTILLASGPYPRNEEQGQNEERVYIPFAKEATTPLSSAQLLNGTASHGALRGKVVFLGVSATSAQRFFATPISGHISPMSDLAVHAQVLSSLLSGCVVRAAPRGVAAAVSLIAVAFLLVGFSVLAPWRSLLLTVVLAVAVTAASASLLLGPKIWLSPAPALAALGVLYPLWSWRRLEMTMSRLRNELRRLDHGWQGMSEPVASDREFQGDVLERLVSLVERAAQRLQYMQRFIWDSLNSIPEFVLVADRKGIVLLANHAARAQFAWLGSPDPSGRTLTEALGEFTLINAIDTASESQAQIRANWPAILDPTGHDVSVVERGLEVRDRAGGEYLLRYKRCLNEQGEESGRWVAAMVEVTALRAAERSREDALRLLSHDMRSHHASILAAIELERADTNSERTRVLLERIERHAQRALKLADGFVQLARAESQTYTLEPVNLIDVVLDANDEMWPQARRKHISVDLRLEGSEYWIAADRSLLTRAMANVINNAVKYSPSSSLVTVAIEGDGAGRVRCTVTDRGYGIPKEMQAHLFEPFRRFQSPGQPPTNGAGLGMAFIKTVVLRHGGDVLVDSIPGKGTTVTIRLPQLLRVPSGVY